MDIRLRHFEPMSSEEWIHFISNNELTKDDLCWLYCCGLIWRSLLTDPDNLPVITKAMLDRGMEPDQLVADELPVIDPDNTRYHTPLIDATRIDENEAAAESLHLLLEHGGNPNIIYIFGDFEENVFEFYIIDIFANAPILSGGTFYGMLLCAAYGGKSRRGETPFTMLIDSPISIFKNYTNYWYEYEENYSTFYVIDKGTGKRVARYH